MRLLLLSILLMCFNLKAYCQITTGGNTSSVLSLTSTAKGVLTPRMTESERTNIVAPATGLLVYQTDNVAGFYFYGGAAWKNLSTATYVIQDGDQNTKMQVDKTPDDDIIRFDISGSEKMTLLNNSIGYRMEFPANNGNILIGNLAGKSTQFVYNIAIGDSAAYNNSTGSFNIALGSKSLFSNISGNRNLAIGSESLYNNTADSNFAIGYKALKGNTSGKLNTSLGYESMLNNSTGNFNTVIGNAFMNNTSGNSNVVVGYYAMPENISGSHNTAVGSYSMSDNQTGDYNSVLSVPSNISGLDVSYTLGNNVDGYENTIAGLDAVKNATSMYQTTAIGTYALRNITTGLNNLAIGTGAMKSLTTGENNIAIGYNTLSIATTGSRNTILNTKGSEYISNQNSQLMNNMTSIEIETSGSFSESNNGVIIGYENNVNSTSENCTAIGTNISLSINSDDQTIIGSMSIANSIADNVITLGSIDSRIGIGTSSPHPSAILDISSTSKGVLFPRVNDKETIPVLSQDYDMILYDKTLHSFYKSEPGVGGGGVNRWTNLNNMFDKYLGSYVELDKIPVWNGINWQWNGTSKIEDIDANSNMRFANDVNNRMVIRLDGSDKFRITSFSYKQMIEPLSVNNCLYFGNDAGLNASISSDNTGIGYNALKNVSIFGTKNTAFGSETLASNTAGSNNTAVGKNALLNNTFGDGNTALGLNALLSNTTGNFNTAIGSFALNDLDNGSYNTAIGHDAEVLGSGTEYSTAIGRNARVAQSHSMVLGAIQGINGSLYSTNVGINNEDPLGVLHIKQLNAADSPILTVQNDNLGFARIKFRALTNTTEEWSMVGKPESVNADARFNFHYTQDILSLHGDGDAILAGTLTETSDKRLKRNIENIHFDKSALHQINGYYYYWNSLERSSKKQIGFIAQEVEKCYPALITSDEKIKSLNYFGITPFILEGIKDINKETDLLSKKINLLSEELLAMKNNLTNVKY